MKKLICTMFVATLLVGAALAAGKTSGTANRGISFQKGTWNEVLALAKKENKLIFLDIYTTWCGPCKMLKNKTFPDPALGAYFNKNFISYAIDAESKDGAPVADKYEVTGYPTLLFVNSSGEVVHKVLGFRTAAELIELGKKVSIMQTKQK